MTSLTKRLFAVALAACGCSKSDQNPTAGSEEDAVKKAFTDLQAAMKARDGEKLFGLLDAESQADAERAAQSVKDAYAKATPAEKDETEKALGLSAAELAALDAKGFLKSKRFHGKYEIAESQFEKATVQGEKATVTYIEDDEGDREKVTFVKQGGTWKASISMPK